MDDFLDPHRRTVVVPETSQVYMMQAPRYRGHWFGDGQRRAAPPLVRRHACPESTPPDQDFSVIQLYQHPWPEGCTPKSRMLPRGSRCLLCGSQKSACFRSGITSASSQSLVSPAAASA